MFYDYYVNEYRAAYEGDIGADRMALGLSINPDPLRGDLETVRRLQRSHARYEYVRRISPRAFTELYKANLNGDGAFDDLVDQMIAKSV